MLLTITCTAPEATDLGYLLHKNPASVYAAEHGFGRALVFYPEAAPERCTAALLLEVDPVNLVRGLRTSGIDQYVNDRPYVASSLLSVALGEAFSTALGGRSRERPERVEEAMPLEAEIAAVDCDGGEPMIRRLFEPLGYAVEVERAPLDPRFPEWGESSLYRVQLAGRLPVRDLLAHLYVLIPVLDNAKHYYVDQAEVEKLLRRGERWLAAHPDKELIARRYLRYKHGMVREALARLTDESPDEEERAEAEEERIEAPVRLNESRLMAVLGAIRALQPPARRVIDLGCGEGRLLELLLKERGLERVIGADVSPAALERAEQRLKLDRMNERQLQRIALIQGSLIYRDERFAGFDGAALMEVIEHLDPPRLRAMEKVVFAHARPRRAVVTTPNAEYNSLWPTLPAGRFRHRDHRFEWTRAEFRAWAERVAADHGYEVGFQGIGPEDAERGAPTQMAVFDRREEARE